MTSTNPEFATAQAFFHSVTKLVSYLAGRWRDEHEHENIEEYKIPLIKAADKHTGVEVLRMMKRPFGFVFRTGSVEWVVKVKARQMTLSRVQ